MKVGGETGDEALDHALRLLHNAEPESRQGLSNHAPMAAEALCALGFADRAVAWVEHYNAPLIELPRPTARIDRERWREALGPRPGVTNWEASLTRWADWRAFFTEELAEGPWRGVLDRWAARLAPGMCAAATHGVIRTAHAARALSRRETSERRAELARGLAYWASAYEELPARAGGPRVASYEQALAKVPLHVRTFGQAPSGNIVNGLRQVGKLERFAEARDLVATPDDVSSALSTLSATFARVYLRHGTKHDSIAFIHAVTGPCALRKLAPHVSPETARAALPYAWQAAAAIYAAYARDDDEAPGPPGPELSPAELAARAVENGDEHAIKFTETLLVEHALRPDPAYLAAAKAVVTRR